MDALRPIARYSIQEEIQERIKAYILANNLQPDDPLPTETQLVEQFRVSRNVVREGLRALESLGVIYTRRGEGRYVSSFNLEPVLSNLGYSMLFDIRDIQEILDVRAKLEVGYIPDAVAAMTEEKLATLRKLVDQMHEYVQRGEPFLDQDLDFHRAIGMAVGNRLLIRLLDVFWGAYRNLRDRQLHMPHDLQAEFSNHAALLKAIEARQVDEAQRLMCDHFNGIKERLQAARLGRLSDVALEEK